MSANDDPEYDCIFEEADELRGALKEAQTALLFYRTRVTDIESAVNAWDTTGETAADIVDRIIGLLNQEHPEDRP